MYRCDHQIECRQYRVAVIESAVIQNITFNTFKNMKGRQFCVQFIHIQMLFVDSFFRKTVCIKSGFAVITDHEVFISLFNTGFGHFFDGIAIRHSSCYGYG